jgi:phosphoribosylformylglycinamidine cyclo-ligase
VAFPSSGLHSNGYSLVRRTLLSAHSLEEVITPLDRPLVDELLEPTTIYVRPLLALTELGLARSAAHITGGGIHENVPRALPEGLGVEIDASAWPRPPIFDVMADATGLSPPELYGVLNMGIGMVVVVPSGRAGDAVAAARGAGQETVVVGTVVEAPGVRIRGDG